MASVLSRLRFRSVVFVLFIVFVSFGSIVGGVPGLIADKVILFLTLSGIGRDLGIIG